MLRWTKWIAPVAGLVLMLGFQQAQTRADDAPATPVGKATITVTVVDSTGKPVSGATVSLFAAPGKKAKSAAATSQPADPGARPARPVALQTSTTGADGTATLTKVPDGAYSVGARLKGQGNGREKVIIADDKDATVTVTLKARAPKPAAN